MELSAIEAAAGLDPSGLQVVWFLLFGVLIGGYAVLDGFDLGTGVLSLFASDPAERRLHLNAIGPVWDGNEVWLLTGGGALFAAFPPVYASVFSGLYLALILLLVALIGRAVALEFRSKVESARWRRIWDWCFGLGSLLPAVLFGVAVGNVLRGLPLDAAGNYTGTFLGLLHPYPLLIGLLGLAMFTCHGALWMTLKTEGELQARMRRWAGRAWIGWVGLFVLASLATFFFAPGRMEGAAGRPLVWLCLLVIIGALAGLPLLLHRGQGGLAFLASAAAIGGQVGLVGLGLYPALVPALGDPALSLTIANASSSERTLWTMLVIALVGMPAVIAYTAFIYRSFRGKVVLDEHSY